ncbi:MAG: hypothetical protein ACRD3D_13125 [Terriglobia bacterium]
MLSKMISVAGKFMAVLPKAMADVTAFEQKVAADKTLTQKLTDALNLADEALQLLISEL